MQCERPPPELSSRPRNASWRFTRHALFRRISLPPSLRSVPTNEHCCVAFDICIHLSTIEMAPLQVKYKVQPVSTARQRRAQGQRHAQRATRFDKARKRRGIALWSARLGSPECRSALCTTTTTFAVARPTGLPCLLRMFAAVTDPAALRWPHPRVCFERKITRAAN